MTQDRAGRDHRRRLHRPAHMPRPTRRHRASTSSAIADPVVAKAATIADRVGATAVCRDALTLLGLGLDAVSVCTPSPTHADLAVAALERASRPL